MTELSPFAIALHALAAIVWVGGMFFAYMVLRPALGALEGPQRLRIWATVFGKFFPWVWAAAILLLLTGYMQVFVDFGDFASAGLHVNIMHWLGVLMVFLYFFLFFGPYPKFTDAVGREDWQTAAMHLNVIRQIVLTNLILGLVVSGVGASGRLWP
ncbi:MAG: CopD family protein [Rhodospirillales bacterium]